MANASEAFSLTMKEGGELLVRFDMVFDDDSSSQADTSLIEMEFRTISFEIIKVLKNDSSSHYKEGDIILINPLQMPASYKIVN
jgi:N-methylhydantoinase B/oxoprolinase/acetone carboxylase alpha subunit